MKTVEEYLKEKNITPETKHHNYDYVYHSVLGAIEQAQKDAFKEGQSSPKIKQLEWVEASSYYFAGSPVGNYTILRVYNFDEKESWRLYFNACFMVNAIDPDEAKAAAQADFEKRVRECLDL